MDTKPGSHTVHPVSIWTIEQDARDHLGSIREVMDGSGAVVASYSYDAWGKRTLLAGSDLATFGFTGHYENQEMALVSTLYRLYDPETGRWQSRDPIAENGGIKPLRLRLQ